MMFLRTWRGNSMQARRAALLTLVFVGVLFESFPVLAQVAPMPNRSRRDSGVDIRTHKFRPVISPDVTAVDASGAILMSAAAIGPSAARQMASLLQDKQSRTATQKKISSKLIYTARMLRGLPAAPDVPSLETGVDVDADGNVLVDITADVTDSLLAQLKEQGASIYGAFPVYRSIRALVPAARLESIASLPDVIFIGPKQEAMTAGYSSMRLRNAASPRLASMERSTRVRSYIQSILRPVKNAASGVSPTGQGSKTSEGGLTHRAFDARMAFGVNGAGIRIGVLSDGARNLAASQALGDLPSDVTVLPGQVGGGDEGTAMMEIVDDLAPGAKLYFATAFSGIAIFAQNIHDLHAAGCD